MCLGFVQVGVSNEFLLPSAAGTIFTIWWSAHNKKIECSLCTLAPQSYLEFWNATKLVIKFNLYLITEDAGGSVQMKGVYTGDKETKNAIPVS